MARQPRLHPLTRIGFGAVAALQNMILRRDVLNVRSGVWLARGARWCSSFTCRLRGLMFQRSLQPGEALILAASSDSRTGAAIHMFFVPFPLGVVWINGRMQVVDMVIAQPWRPSYGPRAPARFTLEGAPEILQQVAIGDELAFATA